MNAAELRRLTALEAAAAQVVQKHPAYWVQTYEDDGEFRCFFCDAVEHNTPEMERRGLLMYEWLEANPGPVFHQQAIKRKNAPDTAVWDRENTRLHQRYNRQLGQWRRQYMAKYEEVWGDQGQHPGTVIEHKEDCPWLKLKEALVAPNSD